MATILQSLPEIRIGRDWGLAITEQTTLGNPFNLSGYTIELCIKMNVTDADNKALYKATTIYNQNLSFGQYTLRIPDTTSKPWASSGPTANYEIIYMDPTGIINTKFAGTVALTPSITLVIP